MRSLPKQPQARSTVCELGIGVPFLAIQRTKTKNPDELIHRLEVFRNQLESQFTDQTPERVHEVKSEVPASPEEVLNNWLKFSKGQPADQGEAIFAGPYTENQEPANESLDLLDSFLSGGQ